METSHEILLALGLASMLAVGGALYVNYTYQESLGRCRQILQGFTIKDRYFCKQLCERDSLLELIDEYKLEDGALAYRLSQNRCGE